MAHTIDRAVLQSDRLGFFVFLALSLHLMIILGLGFSADFDNTATPQLEVTLAQFQSKQAPKEAKFIAQSNQEGSGTLSDQAEITTRRLADFSDNRIRKISAAPLLSKPETREEELVTTVNDALDQIFKKEQEEPEPDAIEAAGLDPELSELSDSIASLEARLDEQQQAFAERPRVRRLTSLSAKQAVDAAYLHSWRSRVEAIGNRYYPTASSRYGIYGNLRLMVAIRYDGSIETIEVLSSSGHAVLDEAAIRIVRMAAPYDPFPPELRATTDRLEIIRTWKFKQNRLSSVQG
jgi:protein TonB